jgi:hypothetical protein
MTPTSEDLPAGTRLLANPNLVLREEEDEAAILFDPDSGAVRVLNVTAVAVWKLLDGTRTFDQLLAALGEEFDAMDANAAGQVAKLLNDLAAFGAVGVLADFQS